MSPTISIAWYGADVTDRIESALAERLEQAAGEVADTTRRLVDVRPARPGDHSPPGESPDRITGRLEQSIFVEAQSPLSQRVGTDLDYGLWLETGTRHLAARPFLTRALEESLDTIQELVTARID